MIILVKPVEVDSNEIVNNFNSVKLKLVSPDN